MMSTQCTVGLVADLPLILPSGGADDDGDDDDDENVIVMKWIKIKLNKTPSRY